MRHVLFTLAVAAGLPSLVAAEAAPTGITVEAQGLRIVKPAPGDNDRLRAFNWFPGTSLSLLVTVPQGGLLDIERKGSKLTAFVDDKGKDLTKASTRQRFGREAGFSMNSNIADDGRSCVTEVEAPEVPSKGATVLTVTGTLVIRAATKKQEFAAENVALKAGTPVKAGAVAFTITETGAPQWGGDEDSFGVTLEAKQDVSTVAGIEFFDAAGKKIEAKRGSSSSMSFGNNVTVTWSYNLKTKVDTARIVVSYWMDMQKVSVPVDLKVGLGL